jgi:hypothetical protein
MYSLAIDIHLRFKLCSGYKYFNWFSHSSALPLFLQLLKEKVFGVMDTHWLNVDPDPAFQVNARIRNRIQEFDDQKL